MMQIMVQDAVPRRDGVTCSFDDCAKPSHAHGLCHGHYTQQHQGKNLVELRPGSSDPVILPPVTLTEMAWAAGFFDGEGYIGTDVYQGKPRPYLRAAVAQTDIRPVLRLQAVLGGNINGPFAPKGNRKPVYYWRARGNAVSAALGRMIPYLCEPKLEQYDKVREILALAREGFVLSTNWNGERP